MNNIVWEIIIVLLLMLLNGFFACSEIALISVRKTRIANLAKQGNKRAKIILQLHKNPESLFATMQVGVSIITIVASAFAGANIAQDLSEYVGKLDGPFIERNSYAISFALVVMAVAYVNLIIGELVPKSLGLRFAETFALLAAYPIWWLSKISKWPVRALTFSSNLILKPFKDSTTFTESRLSEEEIRTLISEGRQAGVIAADEHYMLENVFEFSDLTVGKIMTPRTQIVAFDIKAPAERIIKQAVDSGYSRVPIYQGTLNSVIGVLYTKKLLDSLARTNKQRSLQDFLTPPYFVPNSMKISEVLRRLQRKKVHMAMVTDEHGEIEGLVTMEDILEEIVGDISDETDEAGRMVIEEKDGHYLVLGEVSIVDFNRHFRSELPENLDFTTLSGFILDRLGRFPKEGDTVIHEDLEFTVKEKTLRTVKKMIIKRHVDKNI